MIRFISLVAIVTFVQGVQAQDYPQFCHAGHEGIGLDAPVKQDAMITIGKQCTQAKFDQKLFDKSTSAGCNMQDSYRWATDFTFKQERFDLAKSAGKTDSESYLFAFVPSHYVNNSKFCITYRATLDRISLQ